MKFVTRYDLLFLQDNKVIVFGAGDYGKECYQYLCQKPERIIYVTDNDKKSVEWYEREILAPQRAVTYDGIFIIASKYFWKIMYKQLTLLGVDDIKLFVYFDIEELAKYYVLNKKKLEKEDNEYSCLPNNTFWFSYHLTEHCNLNCAGCQHFSTLAEKEFSDINDYKKDILRIKKIFGYKVERIILLGGEPLLHPKVAEFVQLTRSIFPWSEIWLVTNGILLKQMNEYFWKVLQSTKIELIVSEYPVSGLDYEEIFQLIDNHDVRYTRNSKNFEWGKMHLNLEGNSCVELSFNNCIFKNDCICLVSPGKLYTCQVGAYKRHFEKRFGVKIGNDDGNFIDIYKEDDPNKILAFLAQPIPICKYCREKNFTRGTGWKISKRNIDEWR